VPALENPKHEIYCQHLARGQSASRAYEAAGFKPGRQNAHRLGLHDDIRQRVAELKETRAEVKKVEGRDTETGRFIAGNSGNGGRRPGARNRLTNVLFETLADDFSEHGALTIEKVRKDNPVDYLKIIAAVAPKQLDARLEIDVVDLDAYAEAKGFIAAYRFARDRIGADPLLIEGEAREEGR